VSGHLVGKSASFNITRHGGASARGGRERRCINCGVVIYFGERCETHKRELRQRQRRKPR
jgi:hypothetical protein